MFQVGNLTINIGYWVHPEFILKVWNWEIFYRRLPFPVLIFYSNGG